MELNFYSLSVLYLVYSFLGWVGETVVATVKGRRFANRGVASGPFCFIYGFTAVLLAISFADRPSPLLLFLGCMAVATAIELAATYLMEFTVGSWPWQTYVNYDIHFQGRIALSPSIRFGLGGLFFLYVLQPLFEKLAAALPDRALRLITTVLAAVMAVDYVAYLFRTFWL